MHLSWDMVSTIVGLVATAVGTWLGTRIIKPKDKDRAELLDRIADGCAALILSLYPDKPWAELIRMVIQRISGAAGVPTQSAVAIENAAAGALRRLGKEPGAAK